MPPGSRWSTAMFVRQICGNLKFVVGQRQLVARRRRAGHGGRLVRVRVRVERPRRGVVELLEPGEHAGVADLVRDPDVGRLAGEEPVPPRTCVCDRPSTSQLKPTRGDHRMFGVRQLAPSSTAPAGRSRRGRSGRRRRRWRSRCCRRTARRRGGRRSASRLSARLPLVLRVGAGVAAPRAAGSASRARGCCMQRTWKRRSVTGEVVRFGLAR